MTTLRATSMDCGCGNQDCEDSINTISLLVVNPMRAPLVIELLEWATFRDLYHEVCARTCLPRSSFKLSHDRIGVLSPENFRQMVDCGITSGTKIHLGVNMQTGTYSSEPKLKFNEKFIRERVNKMTPDEVQLFFRGKYTLDFTIPPMPGLEFCGTAQFIMRRPMSNSPPQFLTCFERLTPKREITHDASGNKKTGKIVGVDSSVQLCTLLLKTKLSQDFYDSQGMPARTMETLISMFEGFLNLFENRKDNNSGGSSSKNTF